MKNLDKRVNKFELIGLLVRGEERKVSLNGGHVCGILVPTSLVLICAEYARS